MDLITLERALEQEATARFAAQEPAHDLLHCRRVVAMAKRLCALERGRAEVVVPAAWLHDWVAVAKDDPLRAGASKRSAAAAVEWLRLQGYPEADCSKVAHAIEAHSFSAGIEPQTLEAAIVQDADRLDALGAIGIARCFATAGTLRRPFYCEQDPFCESRAPNDISFTLDHFFAKLLRIADTLRTDGGRAEGQRRLDVVKAYLAELKREIGTGESRGPAT